MEAGAAAVVQEPGHLVFIKQFILLYLVLVGHLSPRPHFFHQKVPEFSLCFQVGLKHLRPAGGADAKGGDTDEQKGSHGYFHRLHRKQGGVYRPGPKNHQRSPV